MTLGKITSSMQDAAFVKVRPEDGTFVETHNGTAGMSYLIQSSVGQRFTAVKWFGRIKVKIRIATGRVRLVLYDSPSKSKRYYENEFQLSAPCVIHMCFDPLPAGDYYYELILTEGVIGVSVITDSTLHKAYKEGSPTTEWDIESKIMYVGDEEERAVAVIGDTVDSGATTVSSGSSLGSLMVGVVERNISREGDSLTNGGKILTGCWFLEMED